MAECCIIFSPLTVSCVSLWGQIGSEDELTIETLELKHPFVCIFIQGCPAEILSISSG